MGREIAYVMGYEGIGWLERSEREKEENVSNLIQNMNIKSHDTIADIGAGSGYHVFRMASLAKQGLVYAVDIQREMLMAIEKTKESNKIRNIETIPEQYRQQYQQLVNTRQEPINERINSLFIEIDRFHHDTSMF